MKINCLACGCHFPQDFEDTFKPPCNLWGDMGIANLPEDYKRRIWDWYFSIPVDEIAVKFNVGISIAIRGFVIEPETLFENVIPGYNELPEEDRQRVQKDYFKKNNRIRQQQDKERRIES